jgi:RNA polymerase sigma factor (sigma-70 family)
MYNHNPAMPASQYEKDLWSGIRSDDKQAFNAFFSLYYPSLYHYGYKIVPQEELIKDSIQELFFNLWEQRKSIGEMYSVKSYMFVSMRRTLICNIRKQLLFTNRNQRYMAEQSRDGSGWEDPLVSTERSRESVSKLQKAMQCLSNRKREVIYLKYFAELSNAEIANLMKIKPQSVYNHVSEAIIELKKYFSTQQ